jgi:hypothetical protein
VAYRRNFAREVPKIRRLDPSIIEANAETNGICFASLMRGVKSMEALETKIVYWHRDLPPLEAELLGEHTVEATSDHVAGFAGHADELWNRCYESLMAQAHVRLEQEVSRLRGHYAHVLDESIDVRRNDAIGEAWLHGRFTYVLYRRPKLKA